MLDQLRKLLTNGKPELLARAINLYLGESPKLMQKLKQAADDGDAPTIARSAHSLKSSSANVGATALSRYCGEIEASARITTGVVLSAILSLAWIGHLPARRGWFWASSVLWLSVMPVWLLFGTIGYFLKV